jgi:hypothetical protein
VNVALEIGENLALALGQRHGSPRMAGVDRIEPE